MMPIPGTHPFPGAWTMEERYEIRGTLGQGGIGSVHRAYDRKLNREVAIKRILSEKDDAAHTEEATRQLIAEAEALAALQHPHIVTILDVGSDEDGPYVVMELLNGKTLDEILENAPLTWEDFAEVAKQSLEALIAAQELDLIHSDLKPANIMLIWLPSGKFQVKILDFGLAVMIRSQSQEEISKLESVYGSIFFMPPEQFERQVLDERSDLYSLGCCFYQALAGAYPFNGETGREVMEAHLNHTVTPLEQVRADVPIWVCQWVMWLLNRDRNDRPATARDALGNFIQNERLVNPEMSLGSAYARRPKLVIPATGLAPPPDFAGSPAATAADAAGTPAAAASHTAPASKKKSKVVMKIAIAAAVVILLGGLGWLIQFRNQKVRANDAYYAMMSMAADEKNETVPVSGEQLQLALDVITNLDPNANLTLVCRALIKAKANDDSSVDAAIATFATRPGINEKLRMKLLKEVLTKRRHADATPILLQFAAQTTDKQQALSAMKAADHMIEDQHAEALLAILTGTSDSEIRENAEEMMRDLIFYSSNREPLAELLKRHQQTTTQAETSEAIARLLQKCKPGKATAATNPTPPPKPGPTNPAPEANPLLKQLLSKEESQQLAAINALAESQDPAAHQALLNFISNPDNAKLKIQAIEAAVRLNSDSATLGNEALARSRFKQISWKAKTYEERKLLIEVLQSANADWVIELLNDLNRNADPATKELIEQTLKALGKGS